MLSIIFNSILITIFTIPFATYLNDKNQLSFYKYTKDIIYGFIIISFLGLLINFFSPLNIYVNSIILLISFILFIQNRKIYINHIFLKFLIFHSILISILIIKSNVYRPDAGLYHLPYIGILNTEKIIIGLSNLHFRYGHTSIIQYFAAVSNNFVFKNNGIVFAQSIIASAVIINFAVQIFNYNKNKIYNFHFFFLLFIFIYMAYKMNRYSEYGNDAPAHFLFFFLLSEIFKNKNLINFQQYGNQLILSLFIILNKFTLVFLVLFNLINLKLIYFKLAIFDKRIIFLFSFFFLWIIKNVLISGCLIYPLQFTCIEKLNWTDIENTRIVQISSEAWTKGVSNQNKDNQLSHEEFLKNFNWIDAWSNIHLKLIIEIILPYLIFSLLIIFLIVNKNKKIYKKVDQIKYIYLFTIFICCLVWFLKSPLYRYGYSFIIAFFSIMFAIYCSRFNNFRSFHSKLFNSILILSILVIVSKNFVRIYKVDSNYFNSPWPKYYSMDIKNNITTFIKTNVNDLIILTPEKGYCMYTKGVCGHYALNSEIKILKNNSFNIFQKLKSNNN